MFKIDKKYGNLNRKTYIDSSFEHLLASNFTESLFLKCLNAYKIFKKFLSCPTYASTDYQYGTSTGLPVLEHRYHPRHMPALRPHLPVRAQYRARCNSLIGVRKKMNVNLKLTKNNTFYNVFCKRILLYYRFLLIFKK